MESVVAVFESIPGLKELKVRSPRTTAVKLAVDRVLQQCKLHENRQKLETFSERLTTVISTAIAGQNKENIWIEFSRVRQTTLPGLWKSFLSAIDCSIVLEEPLFMELTNENLLCRMVKARCASTPQLEETSSPPSLTAVEENIIRYVAGFVGMKLQKFGMLVCIILFHLD